MAIDSQDPFVQAVPARVEISHFFFASIRSSLIGCVIVTALALLLFGFVKGRFTASRPARGAWQTLLVGGLAAAAAFIIATLIS